MRNWRKLNVSNILLVIIIVMVCSAFVIKTNSMLTPPTNSQPAVPVVTPPSDVPYEATFEGEYVCLPHKDTRGPQTLECALGLKTDDGTYVAIDFGDRLQTGEGMNFGTGERLQVKGMFVPIEQISTDMWQKYPITGILKASEVNRI